MVWYGLFLAAILLGLGITAYRFESARLLRDLDFALQARVGVLTYSMKPMRPGDPGKSLDLPAEDEGLFGPATGFYYLILGRQNQQRWQSPNAPADIPTSDLSSGFRTRGLLREVFLSPAPREFILCGHPLEPIRAQERRLVWLLLAFGFGLLAVGLWGGSWLVSRSLRPVKAITAAAAEIAAGDLSHRINVAETESELGELAGLLNGTFERLEAAFAQQARFTADAAHELRTPISVVLTHAQNGLASENLSEEQQEAFAACQRAAQRMRRLTDSLLKLARFDSGQERVARRPFDLARVVRESLDYVAEAAEGKNISLLSDLPPALAVGDADWIGQVITNLLCNAIHYGEVGGEVRIRTWQEAGSSLCEVSDNGPGIAAEHLPHLFERFYRADKARSGGSGRAGLGLAISKAVIDAHGGEITVRSIPGDGARFTIRLAAAAGV